MKITNQTFDQERALYNLRNTEVANCTFDGPADGESALKECNGVSLDNCTFALRYPLWHTNDFVVTNSTMTEGCRAAMWYNARGKLTNCILHGIKAVRECEDMTFSHCDVNSAEFGWKSVGLRFDNCKVHAEYLLFLSQNITLDNVQMSGKYSFQYVKNATISNSVLDTKDAFWHAQNVVVKDCVVKGEYLGWYADNLTFINCKIIGTQPLCYCTNLKLVNCTMEGCDLSFEYSQVDAQIIGHVHSVKNVKSGKIVAGSIGEIINENSVMETNCQIVTQE